MFNKRLKEALGYKERLTPYGNTISVTLEKLEKLEEKLQEQISENKALIKVLYKDKFVYRLKRDDILDDELVLNAIYEMNNPESNYRFGKRISISDLSKLGKYETLQVGDETYIISNKELK